jgi:molybdopterin-synthase adenylyltransferase
MMFTGQRMLRCGAHPGLPHPDGRWAFPKAPPPDLIASFAECEGSGPAAGGIGWLQAPEMTKQILGMGGLLSGTLALHDARSAEVRRVRFARGADCPVCGAAGRNGADHG